MGVLVSSFSMEFESNSSQTTKTKSTGSSWQTMNYSIVYTLSLFVVLIILLHTHSSRPNLLSLAPSSISNSSAAWWDFTRKWIQASPSGPDKTRERVENVGNRSRGFHYPVTFLPLKDLRYAESAMTGNTWFMSSLNDTLEDDEAEYLYFPSRASDGRLLCLKGHDVSDGTRNSYALAWPETLPERSVLLKGLSFVSDSYYTYNNLWHGITAIAPFVGWSMKNKCSKPDRWIFYHQGELRDRMISWVQNIIEANYGEVQIESFRGGEEERAYCLEEAVVMRHSMGKMRKEKQLKVSDQLRCRARQYCRIRKGTMEVNERGEPLIRLTLLMRRGSRSFENASAVVDVFARECDRVDGCMLKVVQSEDLSFCDQVRVMTGTDIVVSPHGAQLTNMLFMDRGSSVMEFFPKGWLELAGIGQYAHHWMANLSGMRHRGSWWEPLGNKECPDPDNDGDCFQFYKNGKVGLNETHFASWARDVLNQVRITKRKDLSAKISPENPSRCAC